jgi:hypothetical protein
MNDIIRAAVVEADFAPEHVDAVAAYLTAVRKEATDVSVQMYVDRSVSIVDRSSYLGAVLSAAFGQPTTTGRHNEPMFFTTDGSRVVYQTLDTVRYNVIGTDVKGVTVENPVYDGGDPMPFRFVELAPVPGELTQDDLEMLSEFEPSDDDDDDDD